MHQPYHFTHRHAFLLGAAYYLLVPLMVLLFGVNVAGMEEVKHRFFEVDSIWWFYFVVFVLLCPLAYLAGSLWRPVRLHPRRIASTSATTLASLAILAIYAALFLFLTFQARSHLFAGYGGEYDIMLRGPISTLQLLLLFQYLYEKAANKNTSVLFGLLLVLNSIVLLGMGGRLYVAIALVSVYFQWWNWESKTNRSRLLSLLLLFFGGVALLTAVGMLRQGSGFNLTALAFYFSAESFFVFISAASIFTEGEWYLLNFRTGVAAYLLNLVPSVIWPDKLAFITELSGEGLAFISPFGAISVVTSTVGNFGFLGGLLFFAAVGAFMTAVGHTRGHPSREALYCYLVGLLVFSFFRDDFMIQFKVVLTGCVLYFLSRLQLFHGQRKPGLMPANI